MTWAFVILVAVALFFWIGSRRGAAEQKKAPNILGDNGFPKADYREGAVRNDEE